MQAFNLVPLITERDWKFDSKIQSVASSDAQLYVGTTDGKLILYSIEVNGDDEKPTARVKQDKVRDLGHGKKSVVKLEVFREVGLLIALCDGYIDALNMYSLEPATPLPISKGVTTFTVHVVGGSYFVTLEVKRRLVIYEYTGRYELIKELQLNEVPLDLAWIGSAKLVLMYKKEYVLVDINDYHHPHNVNTTPITLLPNDKHPAMRVISEKEVLLKQDNLGVFLAPSVPPTASRGSISFNKPASFMAFKRPYIISVQNRQIEVHNLTNQKSMQLMPLPSAEYLGIYDGGTWRFAGAPIPASTMTLWASDHVTALVPLPITVQVTALIRAGSVDEGLALYKTAQKGARDTTLTASRSRAGVGPAQIYDEQLALFEELAGDVLMENLRIEQAMAHYSHATRLDPRKLIGYFPDLVSRSNSVNRAVPQPPITYAEILKRNGQGQQETRVKELTALAKSFLMRYLEDIKRQRKFDAVTIKDIDVALFKLYATEYHPEEIAPNAPKPVSPPCDVNAKNISDLITQDSELNIEELEHYCLQGQYYKALALIYRHTHRYRKALEVWAKLATHEYVDPTTQGFSTTAPHGVHEASELLSTVSDVELISEHAAWLHKLSTRALVTVLTAPRTVPLPPRAVLSWIRSTTWGNELEGTWLEHVVSQGPPQGSLKDWEWSHTELALWYLHQLRALTGTSWNKTLPSRSESTSASALSSATVRAKLQRLLIDSRYYNPLSVLQLVNAISSNSADPQDRSQGPQLTEECITLYGKMGDYEKALDLIVYQLKDYDRAEQFCVSQEGHGAGLSMTPVNENDASAAQQPLPASSVMLLHLLKLYLKLEQSDPITKLPERALHLLNKYPHELNPVSVLSLVSEEVPIVAVMHFLKASMRMHVQQSRELAIVNQLERVQHLNVNVRKMQYTTRSVRVTRDSICPVCRQPIGDKVFAYYPNGVVVHFKCFNPNEPHKCPVTERNFKTHPMP